MRSKLNRRKEGPAWIAGPFLLEGEEGERVDLSQRSQRGAQRARRENKRREGLTQR